ncbi:DNA-binding protein inhibitor ID-2-like [Sinocyclocheilus grahami]|uniref:DNA-binding protein inhibitor ID-4 n=1 Tax=Sinocyclocheilus grahami TaxID=75366 RepID=A0A672QW78_SINGR|nr:PREDICTED: DNA-binding protein inhibitor ID-2-like [Sinocyclocheilus grahami]
MTSSHRPIRLILYASTNLVRLLYKRLTTSFQHRSVGESHVLKLTTTSLTIMKAVSPVRSIRKPALFFSEHNLGSSRGKSSSDDPLSLLYDMNDCYSRLKELVPSLPQNKSVSKMEILQHVIDYILDLQLALDQNPQQQLLGQSPPKKTVRSLGAEISLISFQPSNPQREINSEDLITLSR